MYSSSFNKAIKVTSGANHVMILTEQGDIYTFGKSVYICINYMSLVITALLYKYYRQDQLQL